MVKPYRIKHKASGYFYQRYNGSNLGKKGKVYMNNQSPLTMCDNENFIRIQIRHNTLAYKALTEVLRYFRDNGELKKAYELQKDSLADMANSPWTKLVMGMLTSKMQEDKVDAELPDIDALIKESTSDEFIEKKIKDILGD